MHISHFATYISHTYIACQHAFTIYISHTCIVSMYLYISHTYIAWHCTFIHIHISYIHSMLQHTYLMHTLNMHNEGTNKEWSWAFPNPILTLRILQVGLAQEKPSFYEPPCPPSSWALPPSLSRLNRPPIELFNVTFNPWHTKANNLHLNSMQLPFNYINLIIKLIIITN